MFKSLRGNRFAWLVVGLLVGLLASVFAPHTPSWAVATDRQDTYAVCTGPVDNDLEAFYFLDFLTGDLRAAVLSLQTGTFAGLFEYNIARDLAPEPGKTPRYTIVTGMANIGNKSGNIRPGDAIIYVTEGSSGKVAAYAIPWQRANANSRAPYTGTLVLQDIAQLRTATVR